MALLIAGCGTEGSGNTGTTPPAPSTTYEVPTPSPTQSVTPPTLPATAPKPTAAQSDVKCTDRVDYAGDSRSNAEINSVGADTGKCPAPERGSGVAAQSDVKCTDQLDYAGDPRSNAEINSLGADTGKCPPAKK